MLYISLYILLYKLLYLPLKHAYFKGVIGGKLGWQKIIEVKLFLLGEIILQN